MSCNHFIEVFDSGNMAIRGFSSEARLITGLSLFSATVILPLTRPAGIIMLLFLPIICILIYHPARGVIRSTVSFGLVMFAPLLLLIPFVPDGSPRIFDIQRFADISTVMIPLSLFLKGLFTTIIFISTISSMSMSEFIEAQLKLKIPTFVVMLVTQILQQTGLLYSETVQMSRAISLRGGGASIRTLLIFSKYAPLAWLERIYMKAYRISNAMTVRNYGDLPPLQKSRRLTSIDIIFVFSGLMAVVLSLLIRYGLPL